MREGCYNCHSQMIRPFRAETERYGHYSVAGEFVYDHPFQWGSKRTGPDLRRALDVDVEDDRAPLGHRALHRAAGGAVAAPVHLCVLEQRTAALRAG